MAAVEESAAAFASLTVIAMTTINSEGSEADRIRLKLFERRLLDVERELRHIKLRLSAVAPAESVPFPRAPLPPPASGFYCAYCGKAQEDVALLIAGPGPKLFICNECVDLCHEIVAERLAERKK